VQSFYPRSTILFCNAKLNRQFVMRLLSGLIQRSDRNMGESSCASETGEGRAKKSRKQKKQLKKAIEKSCAHRVHVRGQDILRPRESSFGAFKSETVRMCGTMPLWVANFAGLRHKRHTLLHTDTPNDATATHQP
jgi:hypothetical protein